MSPDLSPYCQQGMIHGLNNQHIHIMNSILTFAQVCREPDMQNLLSGQLKLLMAQKVKNAIYNPDKATPTAASASLPISPGPRRPEYLRVCWLSNSGPAGRAAGKAASGRKIARCGPAPSMTNYKDLAGASLLGLTRQGRGLSCGQRSNIG